MSVKIVYSNSRLPFSPAVRAVTRGRWSHCGLLKGNRVIESTFSHGGVKETSIDVFSGRASEWRTGTLVLPDSVWDAASTQLGKPYDWVAITGIYFNRDWQEDDAWDCAELVAWAADAGGHPLFRHDEVHRIVPHHVWIVDF